MSAYKMVLIITIAIGLLIAVSTAKMVNRSVNAINSALTLNQTNK